MLFVRFLSSNLQASVTRLSSVRSWCELLLHSFVLGFLLRRSPLLPIETVVRVVLPSCTKRPLRSSFYDFLLRLCSSGFLRTAILFSSRQRPQRWQLLFLFRLALVEVLATVVPWHSNAGPSTCFGFSPDPAMPDPLRQCDESMPQNRQSQL